MPGNILSRTLHSHGANRQPATVIYELEKVPGTSFRGKLFPACTYDTRDF